MFHVFIVLLKKKVHAYYYRKQPFSSENRNFFILFKFGYLEEIPRFYSRVYDQKE